jgi:transposase
LKYKQLLFEIDPLIKEIYELKELYINFNRRRSSELVADQLDRITKRFINHSNTEVKRVGMNCTPNVRQTNRKGCSFFMTKYNLDLKLEIMVRIVNDGWGYKHCSNRYGIANSQINRWHKRYMEHGVEGLLMKRGMYSGDFKRNVLEYIQQSHLSNEAVAAHFGIPCPSTITLWEKRLRRDGPLSLDEERRGEHVRMKPKMKKLTTNENSTREELLAEIEQLRMENTYLKKLRALVQKRLRQENAKKSKSSTN